MPVVNYLWNPINDNIVEEFDDAGNTIAEYTTEPDQFGDVISQYRDGQESFYHTDGQGSTLALTNSNGDVTDTYSYSAFGEVTARTGSTVNPFQYIGQKGYYLDHETGEYDVRIRSLGTSIGRWRSTDWHVYLDAINAYLYSANRPTFTNDPSGLIPSFLEINWSTIYQQIKDRITNSIDSEVQNSMAELNRSLDAILALAAALTGKCFKLTIALKSASITAAGTTVPAGLPWPKRAACSAIALTFQSLGNELAVPRIKKQFPITRFKECPIGQMCDDKWTAIVIPVPAAFPFPLGTQSIPLAVTTTGGPIPFPTVTEACNVALSLVVTVTPTGFVANCVTCPLNAGGRPIDPIFLP